MAKSHASHALQWAEQGQGTGAVLLTAHRLIALQEAIGNQLPQAMRKNFAVAEVNGGDLTLIADHSALAAKLRQLQPTLLKHIALAGWNVTTLKIKVASRPNIPQQTPRTKQARPLGDADLDHFETLGRELHAGPLADAVARLIAHHRVTEKK